MHRAAVKPHPPLVRYVPLLAVSLALVAVTPINTDIRYPHMFLMGFMLSLAVAIPYVFSRFVYKDGVIRYPFHHGRRWYRSEVLYIVFTALIAYLLLPFYLRNTGSYLNWTVLPGASNVIRLFLGTFMLGAWDEIFFVATILAMLRQYLQFWYANVVQALLWTSFLYILGFHGWGIYLIFIFAMIQGYIFRRTKSLLYIITIHLTLDFILFLALLHAYHPDWAGIFIIT